MSSSVRLRPLGYVDLIDEAFDLCKGSGAASLAIAATLSIPFWMLFAVVNEEETLALPLAAGLVLVSLATHATLVKLQFERYLGGRYSVGEAWLSLAHRIIPLLLTSGIAGVILLIGAAALALPAVLISLALFFLCHALMLEDRSYFGAIRRSWDLANGHAGRVLLVSLLTALPYLLVFGLFYWIGDSAEPSPRSDTRSGLVWSPKISLEVAS